MEINRLPSPIDDTASASLNTTETFLPDHCWWWKMVWLTKLFMTEGELSGENWWKLWWVYTGVTWCSPVQLPCSLRTEPTNQSSNESRMSLAEDIPPVMVFLEVFTDIWIVNIQLLFRLPWSARCFQFCSLNWGYSITYWQSVTGCIVSGGMLYNYFKYQYYRSWSI